MVELGVDDDDSPAAAFAVGGFTGVLGAGALVVGEAAAPGAGLLKGGFDGGVFAGGAGDGATPGVPGWTAPGASMISAPAAIVDPELPSVTAPPPSVTAVSAEPCSPAPPTDDAETPKVGPAAPGFRMSVAETASVGGLRFGGPACAAAATSGFDLSISSGIFNKAFWRCAFSYACSFCMRATAAGSAAGTGIPMEVRRAFAPGAYFESG